MKAQTCPFGMIMTSCLGKMLDKAKNQGKPRRYLRNINVRWFGFDLSDVQEMRVADDEVERYSIRKGDLVVCEGGEPGRCAIWCDEENVCFQKALHRVRFNEASDPRFYMYYLWMLAKSGMLAAYYTGTGIKHLTGESLKKLPVPVPPLPEQKRIVARIEELFSELDNGVETLKKTKQQLAVYRQAVLKAAFKGLDTFVALGSVAERVFDGPFGTHLKTADYVSEGIRVVRLENIKNARFDDSKQSFISKEKYETIKAHTVVPTDLIMSTFIADSIKVCQLPSYVSFAVNKSDCVGIRLKGCISQKFTLFYLSSREAYEKLFYQVHGATRPRVNTKQIKAIKIPFVPYNEQLSIVSEIESRLSICNGIEKSVDVAMRQTESMRQSILKKAFEGALGKKRRHHVTNNYGAHE